MGLHRARHLLCSTRPYTALGLSSEDEAIELQQRKMASSQILPSFGSDLISEESQTIQRSGTLVLGAALEPKLLYA
jgi:hypothetical protein